MSDSAVPCEYSVVAQNPEGAGGGNRGTHLQAHLVRLHLLGAVVVVQRRLVHLVLAEHLQLLAAQDLQHLVGGQLAVRRGAGQRLDVLQDVRVDLGLQLLQAKHVRQLVDLQDVALVQPGEEEVAAEADHLPDLRKRGLDTRVSVC